MLYNICIIICLIKIINAIVVKKEILSNPLNGNSSNVIENETIGNLSNNITEFINGNEDLSNSNNTEDIDDNETISNLSNNITEFINGNEDLSNSNNTKVIDDNEIKSNSLYSDNLEITNVVVVSNESEIIKNLSNSESTIILGINSEIDITEEINITSTFQKLSFIGNSLNSSKLNLKKPLYFESNIKEIEINNININGILVFKNNKRITFNTVNLNGYIDSYFDKNINEYIKFTNITYNPNGESMENCINLSGNVKIYNSNFYGNSLCRNRLLHYSGLDKYNFELKESYFNGEYECPFLSIENTLNVNIESSHFEKGYSSRNISGGVALLATKSTITIRNCTFNDILSFNDGGAFNFKNNYGIEGSNLNFYNVTSLAMGSIFQISSDDSSKLKFSNIIQKDTGNMKYMRGGGLIMNIENKAEVTVDSYYAENLINERTSGSAFVLTENSKLRLSNLYIKNLKGNGEQDGLFFFSHYSVNNEFIAKNITLEDMYQLNKFDSSIIYVDKNNIVTMEDIKILNSGGYNTNFLNQFDNSEVKIKNFVLDNYYSNTVKEFINYFSTNILGYLVQLTITNFTISNVLSQGVLFMNKNGIIKLNNGEFRNIHVCNKYNNCTSIESNEEIVGRTEFLYSYGKQSDLHANNVTIDNMYGDAGVLTSVSRFYFIESTLKNSHFKNGFIFMDENKDNSGQYSIENSTFVNNTSEYGTIFSIYTIRVATGSSIDIRDCKFINNTSYNFGGVIYSVGEYNNKFVRFYDCIFSNNHARLGDIIYSYSKAAMPTFYSDTSYLNNDTLATIPTYFNIDGNPIDKISILSGESIPEGISYQLFDDYGTQIFFPKRTSNFQFKELVFFKVEINDPSNAKVIGQTEDYCWDDKCTFPSVQVIGNPGNYILSLKLKSFGQYPTFIQDSIDLELEIRKCNKRTHLNQINSNTNFKSCYIPICEPPCSHGNCTNTNYCDCTGTNFKGQYCNEYVKLERRYLLDVLAIVISYIIILITIVTIGMTIYYRNRSIIKGGGIEFLIIILVGIIVNSFNIILLTFNKTTNLCYLIYLIENTGFSLVFGSIFVKTYRIYKIFCQQARLQAGFSKDIMYLVIILMISFHWLMAILWFISKKITAEDNYTCDFKEFKRCRYPISKNLSVIFNFIILGCEFLLSYNIRNVEKRFRESLVVPAYIYILYILLVNIVNRQNEINVIIQDYFNIVGSILSSLVILYDLFIIKFIEIIFQKPEEDPTINVRMFKVKSGNNLNDSSNYNTSIKNINLSATKLVSF